MAVYFCDVDEVLNSKGLSPKESCLILENAIQFVRMCNLLFLFRQVLCSIHSVVSHR